MSWQSSSRSRTRAALVMAMLAASPASVSAADEPCNPIIDGTYCATNMPKKSGYVRSSGSSMTGLEDYSRLVPSAAVGGTPGTLIGVGTRGDRTCFGLLRRSACD